MTDTATPPSPSRASLAPLAPALLITVLVLLVLALANRKPSVPEPSPELKPISLTSGAVPKAESPAATPTVGAADFSALLPAAAPAPITKLPVQEPPLKLHLEMAQMVQKHYSHRDLGAFRAHAGGFGVSGLFDVDEPVQSVFIPGNLFPDELVRAGIVKGTVTVALLVDENGRVTVKRVLSATHPALIKPVVESLSRATYSVSFRNGRPTKVIINRAVNFSADEMKIRLLAPKSLR